MGREGNGREVKQEYGREKKENDKEVRDKMEKRERGGTFQTREEETQIGEKREWKKKQKIHKYDEIREESGEEKRRINENRHE